METTKPILYSVSLMADQKASAIVLGLVAICVCLAVWNYGNGWAVLICLLLPILSIGYAFLPVRLEVNSNGIVRTSLGRTWLIRWSDIRTYQIQHNGLLLLTQQERFVLDPLCAYFLPVPKRLMNDVLYRFRLFVGE
ncbi:MAG: hypothetical protein FWG73_06395 [Planctomycetaceae bacterium]|nr:hypothetical protein [Planctomycetaceae bacterium]